MSRQEPRSLIGVEIHQETPAFESIHQGGKLFASCSHSVCAVWVLASQPRSVGMRWAAVVWVYEGHSCLGSICNLLQLGDKIMQPIAWQHLQHLHKIHVSTNLSSVISCIQQAKTVDLWGGGNIYNYIYIWYVSHTHDQTFQVGIYVDIMTGTSALPNLARTFGRQHHDDRSPFQWSRGWSHTIPGTIYNNHL